MKKIIVPTDFSKEAENALLLAKKVAEKTGAEIELFHVIEPVGRSSFSTTGESTYDPMDQLFMVELMKKVKHKIGGILNEHKNGVSIKPKVEVGSVTKTLLEHIESEPADLVVMGSRGLNDWGKFLYGSNTQKLVNLSSTPVLIVHENDTDVNIESIVFPTNAEEEVAVEVEFINKIQKLFDAKLHILRVVTMNDFYTTGEVQHELDQFSNRYSFENYDLNYYNADTVEEGIIEFAKAKKAGLITMLSHKRSKIGNLFGSISGDIASHSTQPVLTFNKAKAKA